MELRLSRVFDTTPDLWMDLQKNYDLWHAEHSSDSWQLVKPLSSRLLHSLWLKKSANHTVSTKRKPSRLNRRKSFQETKRFTILLDKECKRGKHCLKIVCWKTLQQGFLASGKSGPTPSGKFLGCGRISEAVEATPSCSQIEWKRIANWQIEQASQQDWEVNN